MESLCLYLPCRGLSTSICKLYEYGKGIWRKSYGISFHLSDIWYFSCSFGCFLCVRGGGRGEGLKRRPFSIFFGVKSDRIWGLSNDTKQSSGHLIVLRITCHELLSCYFSTTSILSKTINRRGHLWTTPWNCSPRNENLSLDEVFIYEKLKYGCDGVQICSNLWLSQCSFA